MKASSTGPYGARGRGPRFDGTEPDGSGCVAVLMVALFMIGVIGLFVFCRGV